MHAIDPHCFLAAPLSLAAFPPFSHAHAMDVNGMKLAGVCGWGLCVVPSYFQREGEGQGCPIAQLHG